VPNITPHREQGIGKWRDSDVTFFLKTGFRPDGDAAGGAMTEVTEHGTSHLTDRDRLEISKYINSLQQTPSP
jgi:hypothetical protein